MKPAHGLIAYLILSGAACSANDDVPSPQISAVTPNHATAGTTVLVSGSNFCQQPEHTEDPLACENMGTVVFGVVSAAGIQYTDTSIMADVPGGSGLVQVVVSSAGRSSNTIDFMIE